MLNMTGVSPFVGGLKDGYDEEVAESEEKVDGQGKEEAGVMK
jgi:hypothetical protein